MAETVDEILRASGRTTSLALGFLADAVRNPHKEIEVRDHYDTRISHEALVMYCLDIAHKLGLQLSANRSKLSIRSDFP